MTDLETRALTSLQLIGRAVTPGAARARVHPAGPRAGEHRS
ncbi:MAG: hypothetical protein U5L11_02610 [Arhodomonas sp.]|nr:hypothetical protein [Arhodomonas sp.]